MAPTLFITENWLAENASLTLGGEVHLPADCRLTPAARDVLNTRRIRIRYADEQGRVYLRTDRGFGLVHTQDVGGVAEAVEAPVLPEAPQPEAEATEPRAERPRRERGGRGRNRDREPRPVAATQEDAPAPRGRPFGDAEVPAFLRRPVTIGA